MSYRNISSTGLIPPPIDINDTNKDYSIFISIVVTGVVASLAVVARLSQKYASRNMGLDDYAIIPALVRLL